MAIFRLKSHTPMLKGFLGMSADSIFVLLDGLTSILVYEGNEICFLHASIPDFLLDQSRSQGYHLEEGFWCTQLSIQCLHMISDGKDDRM